MAGKENVWNREARARAKEREPDVEAQARKRVLENIGVKRWVPYAILVIQALILYFIFNPLTTYTPPKQVDLDETGKQAAYSAVSDWIVDSNPLGADASIVSWDGAKRVGSSAADKGTKAYQHKLTVRTDYGWWSVVCTVTGDGKTVGQPSASRVQVDEGRDDGLGWAGALSDLSASDALTRLMTSFGGALAGFDADKLTVVVADPDPDAVFPVLGLGDVKGVTIDKASYLKSGKVDKDSNTSDLAAVRITITLAARSDHDSDTRMTYDVKVSDPDGTPKILAWGPPGSGDTLRNYSNKWAGDKDDMPDYEAQKRSVDSQSATDAAQSSTNQTQQNAAGTNSGQSSDGTQEEGQ